MSTDYPRVECDDNWKSVPYTVQDLYVKYAQDVNRIVEAYPEDNEWTLETPELGTVLIKRAKFFPWMGKMLQNAQIPFGGPNALTSMLLGGAFGAGVGGLGGKLAHWLMPEYVGKDAAKRWAIMGGLGGATVPGMVHAPGAARNMKEQGWRGLFQPTELQQPVKDAESHFVDVLETLVARTGIVCDDPALEKCASIAGGMLSVGGWHDAIIEDPFLNSIEKAVVAGLPYAAGSARGSSWVSPMDVAKVAANTGLGAFYGKAIGEIAGPFLALTPKARQGIQRAGLLAGAIRAISGLV